jgi:hypothetical protein
MSVDARTRTRLMLDRIMASFLLKGRGGAVGRRRHGGNALGLLQFGPFSLQAAAHPRE